MQINSARQFVVDQLQPLFPPAWRWRTGETRPGTIDTIYTFLGLQTITKEPTAPLSQHRLEFKLTLVVPGLDLDAAEDSLGDELEKLLYAIDGINAPLNWSKADKVLFEAKNLAYEIDLTLIMQKLTEQENS